MAKIFGSKKRREKTGSTPKIINVMTDDALITRYELSCSPKFFDTPVKAKPILTENDVKEELECIFEKPLSAIKPSSNGEIDVHWPAITFSNEECELIKSNTTGFAYELIMGAGFYNSTPQQFQKHLSGFNITMSPDVLDIYTRAYNRFLKKQAMYKSLTQKILGA